MEFACWIVFRKPPNRPYEYLTASACIVKGKIEYLDLWQTEGTIDILIRSKSIADQLHKIALENRIDANTFYYCQRGFYRISI